MILVLIVISGVLYFISTMLLPSLRQQGINVKETLFSKEETESLVVETRFRRANTGKKAIVMVPNLRSNEMFKYDDRLDCFLFASIYETDFGANNGCIGLGSCAKVCTTESIQIKDHTAVISTSCNGCGLCVSRCPKNFIKLCPVDSEEYRKYTDDNFPNMAATQTRDLQFWQKCYKILDRK